MHLQQVKNPHYLISMIKYFSQVILKVNNGIESKIIKLT